MRWKREVVVEVMCIGRPPRLLRACPPLRGAGSLGANAGHNEKRKHLEINGGFRYLATFAHQRSTKGLKVYVHIYNQVPGLVEEDTRKRTSWATLCRGRGSRAGSRKRRTKIDEYLQGSRRNDASIRTPPPDRSDTIWRARTNEVQDESHTRNRKRPTPSSSIRHETGGREKHIDGRCGHYVKSKVANTPR
jgi:hypothetical protein